MGHWLHALSGSKEVFSWWFEAEGGLESTKRIHLERETENQWLSGKNI